MFNLIAAGQSEADVLRLNGQPDRREQRGDTTIWTYVIETENGITTASVEMQRGIVTRSEAAFTFKTEPPPPPRP
ncbi:hypothetical protein [Longimicrobium sp.]|uniref:hypothetical protein n=1 Tax=Longimicrobium sp. TaxID=2029185 RepID=UPI002ED7F418